jgi:hypothetical protein
MYIQISFSHAAHMTIHKREQSITVRAHLATVFLPFLFRNTATSPY